MTQPCPVCSSTFVPRVRGIRDYEYGVVRSAILVECDSCGLVTQEPRVNAVEIPRLYPDDYMAYRVDMRRRGLYGLAKKYLTARTIARISARLPEGGTFLEVGCGDCELIRALSHARPDASLLGVDIKEIGCSPPIPRFRFHLGQLEDAELAASSIDVIYGSNLIEHVADPLKFVERCHQLLKAGGTFIGVTPSHDSLDRVIFGRRWAGYHFPRHTYVFNCRNLGQLLRLCGFSLVKIRGSYSFWYMSLANCLFRESGRRRRGLLFAMITVATIPLDWLVNRLTVHGSMAFEARRSIPGPCPNGASGEVVDLY